MEQTLRVDFGKAIARYKALNTAIKSRLVRSAHDCSDGGLGVALAEKAFAGDLGIQRDLRKLVREKDDELQGVVLESASRIIATISAKNKNEFEKIMSGSDFAQVAK